MERNLSGCNARQASGLTRGFSKPVRENNSELKLRASVIFMLCFATANFRNDH